MALSGAIPKAETEKKSKARVKKKQAAQTTSAFDGLENVLDLVSREVGDEAFQLISKYIDFKDGKTFFTSTTTRFNIDKIPAENYTNIVNLKRINDIRRINKFFESVNSRIPDEGIFIDSVETYVRRKARILRKSIFPFNWIHYTFDVIVTRVFPKLPVFKQIYFTVTRGRNRVLSRAETYGRLYSCGFEILETKEIGDVQYFVTRKVKEPLFPQNPTYGPLIRLKRHGKDGELFNVYKLRTMHAYSEYLQEYVYKNNKLQVGGKFKDDFRITTEGKIFRKFWLDEVPMLINLLKGEMKLIGVRPLSSHYFNLYTDELKQKRIQHKPGLIPPFYADMPNTLEEIMESEMKYLDAYEKSPYLTDLRYFIRAWYNIIFKRARSK
jgi:lipopolysaccharide/colanic/teichoic acid biosynthesis glycosyltransferase